MPRDPAALVWMANLACLELHPHPVRADDLDHPDELRVDLDPVPGVEWSQVRDVAAVVRATLDDVGLVGWPKTSGSRGIHIYVRIERKWPFDQVRRAALAFAREVERRAPAIATSKWWKEERHGVFLDYNQNAKDRTIASAYSVRPTPDARVSAPLDWDELAVCDPPGFHAGDDAGAVRRDRRSPRRDRRATMFDRSAARPVRAARARGAGRRAVAAALPEAGRRARARLAFAREARFGGADRTVEAARAETAPHRDRTRAAERTMHWPDSSAGARVIRKRPPISKPADVLVDSMRGRFRTWTRIRVNLQHVPEALRPAQEDLDPNETPDDWSGFSQDEWKRRRPSRARKES